jgi:hypothetical protein
MLSTFKFLGSNEQKVIGIQSTLCCPCPTKVSASLIGQDGWMVYEQGKDYSGFRPQNCQNAQCKPCSLLDLNVTQDQLNKGWYWGSYTQKLLETPSDWVYQEAGRSSCWHKPSVACVF